MCGQHGLQLCSILLCPSNLLPLMSSPPGGNKRHMHCFWFWEYLCYFLLSKPGVRLASFIFMFCHRHSQEGEQQRNCSGPHQRCVLEKHQSRRHRRNKALLQEHLITRSLRSPGEGRWTPPSPTILRYNSMRRGNRATADANINGPGLSDATLKWLFYKFYKQHCGMCSKNYSYMDASHWRPTWFFNSPLLTTEHVQPCKM